MEHILGFGQIQKETIEAFLSDARSLQMFIGAVSKVREDGPLNEGFGICHNAARHLDYIKINNFKFPEYHDATDIPYTLISYYATTWEHSKNPNYVTSYPVPDKSDFELWEGPNLKMRQSLMDHALQCAYKDLERFTQ